MNGWNALKTHLLNFLLYVFIFGKYFGIGGQILGYDKNQPFVFICNFGQLV